MNYKDLLKKLKTYKPHWCEETRYKYALKNLTAIFESSEEAIKTETKNDTED